jgi:hypothetical protein
MPVLAPSEEFGLSFFALQAAQDDKRPHSRLHDRLTDFGTVARFVDRPGYEDLCPCCGYGECIGRMGRFNPAPATFFVGAVAA